MSYNDEHSLNIPAYLRGELSTEKRQALEALIASDPTFAADVEFQKSLRDNLKENTDNEFNTEFGWARLSKAIDADAAEQSPVAANDSVMPSKIWQYAAALLACIAIGQGYLLSTNTSSNEDKYYIAGTSDAGVSVDVKLVESAPIQSLTEFLTHNQGLVTQGPNEKGEYKISFATQQACELAFQTVNPENGIFETISPC